MNACASPSSRGYRQSSVMLDLSTAFAAGGTSSIRLDRLKAVPSGMTRYLDAVDILLQPSLSTGGGGSVTPGGHFNLITQIQCSSRIWGMIYSSIGARSMRLLFQYLTGKKAAVDPAVMGAGAGATVTRLLVRIPFCDMGGKSPHDLSIPIQSLADTIDLTFGAAADVGAVVTINSVGIRACARFRDIPGEDVMPRPWSAMRQSFASGSINLPSGDYRAAFVDETDEVITEAEWGAHTVLGHDPVSVIHQAVVAEYNAENAIDGASELVPNAAEFIPLIRQEGRIGKKSSLSTHGAAGPVAIQLDTGSLTTPNITMLRHYAVPVAAQAEAFRSVFPHHGPDVKGRIKTRSKRHLPIGPKSLNLPIKGVK